MLIVEGPDGAGKTTLVNELSEEFDLQIGERGRADRAKIYESPREDTYTALGAAAQGKQKPLIWDRLFYSEFAYYDVTGRTCQFNAEDIRRIPRLIAALECPVIFCMPPWEVVKANAQKDEQMDGVIENLDKIYQRYKAMLNPSDNLSELLRGATPRLIYDYTGETPYTSTKERVEVHIETYLAARRARSW